MICISTIKLDDGRIAWFLVWTCILTKSPGFVFGLSSRWSLHRHQSSEKKMVKSTNLHLHYKVSTWEIFFGTSISFQKELEFFLMMCLLPGTKRSASKKLGPWCQQGLDGWMENYQVLFCPEVRVPQNKRHTPPHIFPCMWNMWNIYIYTHTWYTHTPDKPRQWNLKKMNVPGGTWKNISTPKQTISFVGRQRSWRNIVVIAWTGSASIEKPTTRSGNGSSNNDTSRFSFPRFFCWEEFEALLKWRWRLRGFLLEMLRTCIVC